MDTVQTQGYHLSPQAANAGSTAQKRNQPAGTVQKIGPHKLAKGLGWFGVALGTAQLLFPRQLAKLIGTPSASPTMMRVFGLREIASSALIFNPGRPRVAGLWARVAGD